MRSAGILMLMLVCAGCSKHKDAGPTFTSLEGSWTYTTPDNKINVTFDLVKSGDTLDLKNPSIKVDGTTGNAYAEIASSSATVIDRIAINANDAKLAVPYNIIAQTGAASTDFKTITFATAVYSWPWGTDNHLTSVEVKRK